MKVHVAGSFMGVGIAFALLGLIGLVTKDAGQGKSIPSLSDEQIQQNIHMLTGSTDGEPPVKPGDIVELLSGQYLVVYHMPYSSDGGDDVRIRIRQARSVLVETVFVEDLAQTMVAVHRQFTPAWEQAAKKVMLGRDAFDKIE